MSTDTDFDCDYDECPDCNCDSWSECADKHDCSGCMCN